MRPADAEGRGEERRTAPRRARWRTASASSRDGRSPASAVSASASQFEVSITAMAGLSPRRSQVVRIRLIGTGSCPIIARRPSLAGRHDHRMESSERVKAAD